MPPTPPPVCHHITSPHPCPPPPPNQPFLTLLPSKAPWKSLDPGYLRRPDPSLIALSHNTVSQLHDSADTLTQAHLPAPYLSIGSGKSTSWANNMQPVSSYRRQVLSQSNVSCTYETLCPEQHYSAGHLSLHAVFGFHNLQCWKKNECLWYKQIKMFCSWANKENKNTLHTKGIPQGKAIALAIRSYIVACSNIFGNNSTDVFP